MASRYIELRDKIIVEVGSPGEKRQEMHGADLERVDATMELVGDLIEKIARPIGQSFRDMRTALDVPIEVGSAELEIGVSFSAEGNLFVAKATTEGSLKLTIVFRPVKDSEVPGAPTKSPAR